MPAKHPWEYLSDYCDLLGMTSIVNPSVSVMQAFHRILIWYNKTNVRKLKNWASRQSKENDQPKPSKYTKKNITWPGNNNFYILNIKLKAAHEIEKFITMFLLQLITVTSIQFIYPILLFFLQFLWWLSKTQPFFC